MKKLSPEEIQGALHGLPQWRLEGHKICRNYEFANFVEAFDFMSKCALLAERLNHHPSWLNIYNRVEVTLWTHKITSLSELDFELAKLFDEAAVRNT